MVIERGNGINSTTEPFGGIGKVCGQFPSYQYLAPNINGDRWIKMARKKTKAMSSIPILPTAEGIIEKYSQHPYVVNGKGVLPVLTNQKSNAYLKEIADVCGIHKNLTTHLARHTFATTVTLSKGVSISTVSKMLGHRSLKTTQIYAKVLDSKIADEMNLLKKKLAEEAKNLAVSENKGLE